MKFTHLIVTKVNIKWLPESRDEKWLNDRIVILNNILRPSIESQTNQDFKFVTLWGYEPVGKINNEYQIILKSEIASELYKEWMPKLIELIDTEYVLTTRIDTDNCFSYDFVEKLYEHITEIKAPYYYDVKKIDMFNSNTGNKSTWNAKGTSGFISVMEKKSEYKCIPYMGGHGSVGRICDGLKFDDLDALLTIHGNNIHMRRELGRASDFNLKKYNIKL